MGTTGVRRLWGLPHNSQRPVIVIPANCLFTTIVKRMLAFAQSLDSKSKLVKVCGRYCSYVTVREQRIFDYGRRYGLA